MIRFLVCSAVATAAVGCGVPNDIRIRGVIGEPNAVRDVWFTHDDAALVVVTPTDIYVVDVAARTGGRVGDSAPQVWVSPVSRHLVALDPESRKARMYTLDSGEWSGEFLIDAVAEPKPAEPKPADPKPAEPMEMPAARLDAGRADRPLGDDPVPAPAPAPVPAAPVLGIPRVPAEGETWPSDPLKFWVNFAADRLRHATDDRPLREDDIVRSLDAYAKSRKGIIRATEGEDDTGAVYRMVDWSQEFRPKAPVELDSPRRFWRVHVEPFWAWDILRFRESRKYFVNIKRERLKTGETEWLIDSERNRL